MISLLAKLWEAAAPGLLGRGGVALRTKFRKALCAYYVGLSNDIDMHAQDGADAVEPYINSLITKSKPGLERLLHTYALAGYNYNANLTAMHESATDDASITKLINNLKNDELYQRLDKMGPQGREAAEYAAAHAATAATEITDTMRDAIRQTVANGILQQRGVQGIKRDIKTLFTDMSNWKAKQIATTELNTAMSTATFAKIKRVGLPYKRWIDHEGACPVCQGNAAQGAIPVDEPFASGHMHSPAHPTCKCQIAGVREERKDDYGS